MVIPFVHCTTKLCCPRLTYSSLSRNQDLNAFSLHGASQLICCLLDLFTEREVSAKLVGPGTRSGSACPRSPVSLREANGRVSTSFDLVKLGTKYTYRCIHNSLVRCSAFDIKFEIYQSNSVCPTDGWHMRKSLRNFDKRRRNLPVILMKTPHPG